MTVRMRIISGEARRTTYRLDDFLPPLPSSSPFLFSSLSLAGHPRLRAFGSGQRQQVVGDHSQPDPTFHSLRAAITTTREPMSSLEGADPPFASCAPALRPSGGRQASAPGQRHMAHSSCPGRCFVGRRTEAGIGGGQVRRSAEDLLVSLQTGVPQFSVLHPLGTDFLYRPAAGEGWKHRAAAADWRAVHALTFL